MLEYLIQVEVFGRAQKIKVDIATRRIDILDAEWLRPGRHDRKSEFPNTNVENRISIMKIHSRKMNLLRGIDLQIIAERC